MSLLPVSSKLSAVSFHNADKRAADFVSIAQPEDNDSSMSFTDIGQVLLVLSDSSEKEAADGHKVTISPLSSVSGATSSMNLLSSWHTVRSMRTASADWYTYRRI